ncbi:MAG: sialidase family protein [Planctomycetaceae bacterium]
MTRYFRTTLLVIIACGSASHADDARFESRFIFPLDAQHNHAAGITELTGGSLLVSWYRGSGERKADDVAVFGSRLVQPGDSHKAEWSEPFIMADTPGFPDCNTCLMTDHQGRVWLFWPVIIANSWESCITRFRVADLPEGDGSPQWSRDEMILLKPDDFSMEASLELDKLVADIKRPLTDHESKVVRIVKERLPDKMYQRLGWQPRCKPTVLPSGRILLPLYSDTYSLSLMAVSDDQGASWYASKLLVGFGAIQPSVIRRNDGTLVALMRENGYTGHIRQCESHDDGLTWGDVTVSRIPNPGSGLDTVRLRNGNWVLVCNDTSEGRHRLSVLLSEDEGQSWPTRRTLEDNESGSFHYPAIIQSKDGQIHVVYSYFVEEGKTIKHATFNEDWIRSNRTAIHQ